MPYSDEELLAAIRAVAAHTESAGAPTLQEFRDHGSMAATTVTRRFGSWQEAVEKAGFEPRSPAESISKADLLEELHRVADVVDQIPTGEQMTSEGAYSVSAYQTHFGSWTAALEDAFDDTTEIHATRSSTALLDELQRVADAHATPPRYRDMDAHGEYAARTYVNRFGSWNDALEAAGFTPREEKAIPESALLAELQRLHSSLGHRPSSDEAREHSEYGVATYQRRFGSWANAVAAAFDDDTAPAGESDSR
ncbi:homing endonuclease associated repeat-containing protein [Halorubrum sp. N11]|uniref:homing endonuclease associated repeat-containing protein n=1 Tax=Halorubrum sp. N11 TaxID=3402276 RepID=UPI003EBB5B41